ncbi:hypothetical protein CAMRE0001_1463 [Campylobacter rectus RM3267]|uniref:Uncharacterized protein n=1 Tax=Campylobacter rectus RM3267 TaxID=553218 RepID=B9D329_CAMRE|nr:hypothetical protein CAMRE0001_1463 [Campylobacter rectus RM3267]
MHELKLKRAKYNFKFHRAKTGIKLNLAPPDSNSAEFNKGKIKPAAHKSSVKTKNHDPKAVNLSRPKRAARSYFVVLDMIGSFASLS